MKKFLTVILAFTLVLGCMSACEKKQKDDYVFAVPDGAPGLAVASLMENCQEIDGHKITYKIVPAANIATEITSGNSDIVLMPTNASAKLYNKGVDLKLVTANVFGVLYMVGKEQITSLNDLVGKVVYNIGQGGTPDLVMRYILKNNDIEYVESTEAVDGKVALAYESEASVVVGKLKNGAAEYGILGQPVVENAIAKAGVVVVCDLQSEWQKLTGDYGYPQAGVAVSGDVAKDKSFVNALIAALSANKDYVTSNPENAKNTLAAYESALGGFDLTETLISRCNIGCVSAKDVRQKLEKYFSDISEFDNTFIGGKLPDDGYYYSE